MKSLSCRMIEAWEEEQIGSETSQLEVKLYRLTKVAEKAASRCAAFTGRVVRVEDVDASEIVTQALIEITEGVHDDDSKISSLVLSDACNQVVTKVANRIVKRIYRERMRVCPEASDSLEEIPGHEPDRDQIVHDLLDALSIVKKMGIIPESLRAYADLIPIIIQNDWSDCKTARKLNTSEQNVRKMRSRIAKVLAAAAQTDTDVASEKRGKLER